MKKGQTLKTKAGYEAILFPMEVCRITQGVNGQYSHQGTNAIDNGGKNSGIDPIYAPVTMKHVWRDSAKNGNAVFFESVNKVQFADGSIDYCTLMFIHDNYIGDYKVGQVFKQGQEFGDEGTAGNATGNHTHIEVAKGKYTKPYIKNKFGVFMLPNSIHPNKAFYINGTTVKEDLGYNFKSFNENSEQPSRSYKVGDTVSFNGIYTSSSSTTKLKPAVTKGTITKIVAGARNPYLIGNGVGWINDSVITSSSVAYFKAFNSGSIVSGLNSIGVDSSFSYRTKIANANGISNYTGTAQQNTKLCELARQGKLIKP